MIKNKSILMIGTSLSTKGGMTTVVERFLNHKWKNCNIYFLPTHIDKNVIIQLLYFSFSLLNLLYYYLFKEIDIVHVHFSEKGSFYRKKVIVQVSKIFKKKIIIHMHGAEFKEFYETSSVLIQNSIKKMLEDADVVIVLGKSWEEYVSNISNKINLHIFRNSVELPSITATRSENNIFNVLFLAVLIKRKGIYDLIYAAKEIVNKGYTNIRFIIAGSGEEEQNIKELIERLDLKEYFVFMGWISGSEKQNIISNCQAFVLPSYNEGLPVGILEAMSYGVPVITTNVGSITDVVRNGENGYIITPGNIESLSYSIIDCANNPDKWIAFSQRSREIIFKKYNECDYFERIEYLYHEC